MTVTAAHRDVARGRSIVLVGLGNIGSAAVQSIARLDEVAALTLVDPQRYDGSNLTGQTITHADLGRPKVEAMADQARAIDPRLEVTAVAAAVEDVPPERLDCDVILTGLDSRRARSTVNRLARGLGIPWWIDAGVDRGGLMARVTAIEGAAEAACLECGWSDEDYDAIEHRHRCSDDGPTSVDPAPTAAPAALGQLAAAMLTLELIAVLGGAGRCRSVLVSWAHGRHLVSSLRANPQCRVDHRPWPVGRLTTLPSHLTVEAALGLGGDAASGSASLAVEGKSFVRVVACPVCGGRRTMLRLEGRLPSDATRCTECGRAMRPVGFDMLDRLEEDALHTQVLAQPLRSLGFEPGDHFIVRRHGSAARYALPLQRR